MTATGSRRIAFLDVSGQFLLGVLANGGNFTPLPGHRLPDDAWLVDARYNMITGLFRLYLASETFAEVPEGSEPPMIETTPAYRTGVSAWGEASRGHVVPTN